MIDVSKCLEALRDYRRFGFGTIGGPDKKVAVKDVIEVIEGLEDRIRDLQKMVPKWISVEERLPENFEERVLVCIEDGNCIIGNPSEDTDRFDPIRKRWVRYGDMVTHWMPLPEPPKEG